MCPGPSKKPYWSLKVSWRTATHRQAATPAAANTAPLARGQPAGAAKTRTQGKAKAKCSGRATRLGTNPQKIRPRWKTINTRPAAAQARVPAAGPPAAGVRMAPLIAGPR